MAKKKSGSSVQGLPSPSTRLTGDAIGGPTTKVRTHKSAPVTKGGVTKQRITQTTTTTRSQPAKPKPAPAPVPTAYRDRTGRPR